MKPNFEAKILSAAEGLPPRCICPNLQIPIFSSGNIFFKDSSTFIAPPFSSPSATTIIKESFLTFLFVKT